jgi:hypothetical protein
MSKTELAGIFMMRQIPSQKDEKHEVQRSEINFSSSHSGLIEKPGRTSSLFPIWLHSFFF